MLRSFAVVSEHTLPSPASLIVMSLITALEFPPFPPDVGREDHIRRLWRRRGFGERYNRFVELNVSSETVEFELWLVCHLRFGNPGIALWI